MAKHATLSECVFIGYTEFLQFLCCELILNSWFVVYFLSDIPVIYLSARNVEFWSIWDNFLNAIFLIIYRMEEELKSIFPFSSNVRFETFVGDSNEYKAVIRCDLNKPQELHDWVRVFEASTNSQYRICGSYDSLYNEDTKTRIAFKKDYECRHSTRQRLVPDQRINKIKENSANTCCKSKMVVKIKSVRSRDIFSKEGLRAHITIDWNHNHVLNSSSAAKFRHATKQTKDDFQGYFVSQWS